jgi:hypothetical protein
MKKNIFFLIILSVLSVLSCGKQDDVYKEFIVEGGHVYPAKIKELKSTSGYQRVILEWDKPFDPSIRTVTVFWDNYSKSMDLNYADFPDNHVSVVIPDLEDRAYTFDVVNADAKGNQSLATELSVTPFGNNWLTSHTERSVVFARMDGEDAKVQMTKATLEMVATKFRYTDASGKKVESDYLSPKDVEMTLPDAARGKRFEFKSAYLPSNGIDTVWAVSWSVSPGAIVYPMSTEGWTVTVTDGQEMNASNACENILDGDISASGRWQSSHNSSIQRIFPKILSIDTHAAEGEECSFTEFLLYQNPSSATTLRYMRNYSIFVGKDPYDPDVTIELDEGDTRPVQDQILEKVIAHYGNPALSTVGNRNEAVLTATLPESAKGRYLSIVFTNSFNANGWLDLWELVPYGYKDSEAD